MRGGIWVLNIFAAIWFVVGVMGAGLPWAALVIPAAVSGALLARGSRAAADSRVPGAHVGRLVGIWSAIEGVAIFVAVTICQNIGARDAIVPTELEPITVAEDAFEEFEHAGDVRRFRPARHPGR